MADQAQGREPVEYILHTRFPRFLAKVMPQRDGSNQIIVIEEYDAMPADNPLKVAGLMRRMGDWFVAYCQWEEENYGDYEED